MEGETSCQRRFPCQKATEGEEKGMKPTSFIKTTLSMLVSGWLSASVVHAQSAAMKGINGDVLARPDIAATLLVSGTDAGQPVRTAAPGCAASSCGPTSCDAGRF